MNNADSQYQDLADRIMHMGNDKSDRTGTGTLSLFGEHLRFDLTEGFPILTSKRVHFKSVIGELLWFLSGSTSAKELREKYGVTIWDEWQDASGELGPVYGKQWRDFGGVDQIKQSIHTLRTNPDSRRILVSAWNAGELDKMALMPCHVMFQFYTRPLSWQERMQVASNQLKKSDYYFINFTHEDFDSAGIAKYKLSCHLYQRSCDVALGLPFNIASYAALTHMIAAQCNMVPNVLHMSFGDVHIYKNHLKTLRHQLLRHTYALPTLELLPADDIFSYKLEDFKLNNYKHSGTAKYDVAV